MKLSSKHLVIYEPPGLSSEDLEVLEGIHQLRRRLRLVLRTPKRWEGGLRRSALARAIRGSNSIEGYHVAEDDAVAAVDDEEPISADEKTFLEIQGYRDALGYVLARGRDSNVTYDATELLAMHFMMLRHDSTKSPGSYRTGPIYVRDDRSDRVVYEGPDAEIVPSLVSALVDSLRTGIALDPIVRSAMAHLNLVMIHPFRDGNGRMARALATLVLTRSEIGEPEFSSVEEWLGANTDDYYSALAHTGQGAWRPRRDAQLWLSFNLRAHHMQAQTVDRRFAEATVAWQELDELIAKHGLPDRVSDAMFDAFLGYRVRRSSYLNRANVGEQTATRDLSSLVASGLLAPHGVGRGRFYTAGEPLMNIRLRLRSKRKPLRDPYPWLPAKLRESI